MLHLYESRQYLRIRLADHPRDRAHALSEADPIDAPCTPRLELPEEHVRVLPRERRVEVLTSL